MSSSSPPPRFLWFLVLLLVVIGALFMVGRNLQPPGLATRAQLEEVKGGVLGFFEEQGRAPESLEEVVAASHLTQLPVDRSGNPVQMSILADAVELRSLGPDGRQGGWMFKKDTVLTFPLPR